MTVGTGFIIALIGALVIGGLMLLLEDFDIAIVLLWLVVIVFRIFSLIVVVFWFYAMVAQNMNPLEAFGYVMWE